MRDRREGTGEERVTGKESRDGRGKVGEEGGQEEGGAGKGRRHLDLSPSRSFLKVGAYVQHISHEEESHA